MQKPNFESIAKELKNHAQNLQDNSRIGESKIVLAFAEMVPVMEWSSSQQDTNNIQIANLTDEIKTLKDISKENLESSKINTRSSTNLAFAAIFVAVAVPLGIFWYQNYQIMKNTSDAINGMDQLNCSTAQILFTNILSDFQVHHISIESGRYSTDIYRNNMPYLLAKYGTASSTLKLLFGAIKSMDESDQLLDSTNSVNQQTVNTFINTPTADKMSRVRTYDQEIEQLNWQIAGLASTTLVYLNQLDPKSCNLGVLSAFPPQNFSTFSSY